MENEAEELTLDDLEVGSFALNLSGDVVIHTASIGDYSFTSKSLAQNINQLEYHNRDGYVFLNGADIENTERAKATINKGKNHLVIGKDIAYEDVIVPIITNDDNISDAEIAKEELFTRWNLLEEYFGFEYGRDDFDVIDEITSTLLEKRLNKLDTGDALNDNELNALGGAIKALKDKIIFYNTDLSTVQSDISSVNNNFEAHKTDSSAHSALISTLNSNINAKVSTTDFNTSQQEQNKNVEDLKKSIAYQTEVVDTLERNEGRDVANYSMIFLPSEYVPRAFNGLEFYTHDSSQYMGSHLEDNNYFEDGEQKYYFYIHVFKCPFAGVLNFSQWDSLNWVHKAVSIDKISIGDVGLMHKVYFDKVVEVSNGECVLLAFSTKKDVEPFIRFNLSGITDEERNNAFLVRTTVTRTVHSSDRRPKIFLNKRNSTSASDCSGGANNNWMPVFSFIKNNIVSNNSFDDVYVTKNDYLVQERVTCTALPTQMKAGVVYDLGNASYVYSGGSYNFSSLALDSMYDGKVVQCELRLSIPVGRESSEVVQPSGWKNENGAYPFDISAISGKTVGYKVISEGNGTVILKQLFSY